MGPVRVILLLGLLPSACMGSWGEELKYVKDVSLNHSFTTSWRHYEKIAESWSLMQEDRLNYCSSWPRKQWISKDVKWVVAFAIEEFITVAKLMTASQKFLLLPEALICCLLFVIHGIFKLRPDEYTALCIWCLSTAYLTLMLIIVSLYSFAGVGDDSVTNYPAKSLLFISFVAAPSYPLNGHACKLTSWWESGKAEMFHWYVRLCSLHLKMKGMVLYGVREGGVKQTGQLSDCKWACKVITARHNTN